MGDEEETPAPPKLPKALLVLSSAAPADDTPGGYSAPSVAAAYAEFVKHGWEVGFASPDGTAAEDGSQPAPASWDDEKKALVTPAKITGEDGIAATMDAVLAEYDALFLIGGAGAMVDFAECAELQAMVKAFYEAEKKVVAASKKGTAALLNVDAGEAKLLTDKACTGAAETKEAMVALAGKLYKVAAEVVTVGDLITGSDAAVIATHVVYYFDTIKATFEPPRLAMLAERAALVQEIEEAEFNFTAKLGSLKEAADIEALQMKSQVGRDYRAAKLGDLDVQLSRNATMRQAALDAKAKAEAEVEE